MNKPKFKVKTLIVVSLIVMLFGFGAMYLTLLNLERSQNEFLSKKLYEERKDLESQHLSESEIADRIESIEFKIRMINNMRATPEQDKIYQKKARINTSLFISAIGLFIVGPIIYFLYYFGRLLVYKMRST